MKYSLLTAVILIGSLAQASTIVDPVMGFGFSRHLTCSAKLFSGRHPVDANLLIIGRYQDASESEVGSVALLAGNNLRFAVKITALPNQGQPTYQALLIAHNLDNDTDYQMGQITIDLNSGNGALRSFTEDYVLGSFELKNCHF